MITGLWYTHALNFAFLSEFWRCKEHPCPLSPHLGLWRMLKVNDWGSASWSWFEYGHWSLRHPWSKFWSLSLFWKCKELPCPSSPVFGLWMMLEVPDLSLTFWSLFGFGHWCLIHYYVKLLNPKQNKAKLLGWVLLSQNPTTTYTYTTDVSNLLPRPTEKINYLAPIRDIDLKFWG